MATAKFGVRPAGAGDLEQINEIYNQYIRETHYTFDIEPMPMSTRTEWFGHYAESGPHRLFVALLDDRMVGYASSGRFRPKAGYNTSVETSIYLTPDAVGKGAGTRLYETLFTALKDEDLHRAYAGVTLPNPASIALHERFGFKRVALFTEQGRKFDRFWDVAWFEKPLGPQAPD